MQIVVIYDNNCFCPGLKPDWGFSCLVRTEQKAVLFDTGANYDILLENMEHLGITPLEINAVVLSHLHQDHAGGLPGLLRVRPGMDVYLPFSTGRGSENIAISNGQAIQVRELETVSQGILVAAQADTLSLLLDAGEGLVMLASRIPCKVLEMVEHAKEARKEDDIQLLIAAFCLSSPINTGSLVDSFMRLGVRRIAPCHCCDEDSRSVFSKRYGKDYIPLGVGSVVSIV